MLKLKTFLESDKGKNFYFLIITFYIVLNLITLNKFPLPWQDEIYNVSITESLFQHGVFEPKVVKYTTGLSNDIRYGPIYFVLAGISIPVFGVSMFSFRFITFLSGILSLWVFYRLISFQDYGKLIAKIAVLLVAIDPYFLRCMHEGRMELTALLFIFVSLYVLQLNSTTLSNRYLIVSGFCLALSVLTTPRVGFMWIALTPYLINLLNAEQSVRKLYFNIFLLFSPIVILYSLWILYAFGGFNSFVHFYIEQAEGYTQVGGFYSFIQKNQLILIPLSFLSMAYGIFTYRKYWFSKLHIAALLSIAAFYLVVKDPGPYAVYITPFFYVLLISPWHMKDKTVFLTSLEVSKNI